MGDLKPRKPTKAEQDLWRRRLKKTTPTYGASDQVDVGQLPRGMTSTQAEQDIRGELVHLDPSIWAAGRNLAQLTVGAATGNLDTSKHKDWTNWVSPGVTMPKNPLEKFVPEENKSKILAGSGLSLLDSPFGGRRLDVKGASEFAGDVLVDPTTYFGAGAVAPIVKKAITTGVKAGAKKVVAGGKALVERTAPTASELVAGEAGAIGKNVNKAKQVTKPITTMRGGSPVTETRKLTPVGDNFVGKVVDPYKTVEGSKLYAVYDKEGKLLKGGFDTKAEAVKYAEGLGKAEPKAAPKAESIPVMITRQMEADLKAKGFSQPEIDKMTPQQAWDKLSEADKPAETAPPVPPKPPPKPSKTNIRQVVLPTTTKPKGTGQPFQRQQFGYQRRLVQQGTVGGFGPPGSPGGPPPSAIAGGKPPSSAAFDKLEGALEDAGQVAKKETQRLLKFQENVNDAYYGLKQLQKTKGLEPVEPGSLRDLRKQIEKTPGAYNIGMGRARNVLGATGRAAPEIDLHYIDGILAAEHYKTVLASKGPGRVMPGGFKTAAELDEALDFIHSTLGTKNYEKARKAAEVVRDRYRAMLDELVNEEMITREFADELTQKYPWYNPIQIVDHLDEINTSGMRANPFELNSLPIKKLTEEGTESAAIKPLQALATAEIKHEVAVQKNRIARTIVDLLYEGKADIRLALKGQPVPENSISYFKGGQRVVVEVPDWVSREMDLLTKASNDPVADLIAKANMFTKVAYTGASPAFVAMNAANDQLTAALTNGVMPWESARELVKSFRGWDKDPTFQAFVLSGAYQTRAVSKPTWELAKELGLTGDKMLKDTRSFTKKLLWAIPNLAEKTEQATRRAIFVKSLNKNLPGWRNLSPEEVAATSAANIARDAALNGTVNYQRGGYLIKKANYFQLFLNAQMEASKLPFRMLRDSPGGRVRLAGLLTGYSALQAYNMSYEEYKDIPDYIRYGAILVMLPSNQKNPDGTSKPNYFLATPRTREWSLFFGSLAYGMERMLDAGKTPFGQFASTLMTNIGPLGSGMPGPVALAEVGAQLSNYDIYRGGPIVSPGQENLTPPEQKQPWTSRATAAMAGAVGLSPVRTEHALYALGGGAEKAAMSVIDSVYDALAPEKTSPEIQMLVERAKSLKDFKAQQNFMNSLTPEQKAKVKWLVGREQQSGLSKAPVVGGIGSRFMPGRGGQLEQNAYTEFNKAVEETKAEFRAIPGVVDLGVPFGPVGDSLNGQYISVQDRTKYQRRILEIAKPQMLRYLAENLNAYMERKKEVLTDILADAREEAKWDVIKPTVSEAKRFVAKKILQPYFAVEDQVWQKQEPGLQKLSVEIKRMENSNDPKEVRRALELLTQYPKVREARAEIAKTRWTMRISNRRLDEAYRLYNGQ